MWICPKCKSKLNDSFKVCSSCGTSQEGEQDPSGARARATGPVSDAAIERADELRCAPPGWIECYRTGDLADAALLTEHLKCRGVSAALIREPWGLGDELAEVTAVVVSAKHLPRARRIIERIARRRARRQRPAKFTWNDYAVSVVFAFWLCTGVGFGIGVVIGAVTGWLLASLAVGGGLGFLVALFLMIWLNRVRKRVNAVSRQPSKP